MNYYVFVLIFKNLLKVCVHCDFTFNLNKCFLRGFINFIYAVAWVNPNYLSYSFFSYLNDLNNDSLYLPVVYKGSYNDGNEISVLFIECTPWLFEF